MGEKALKSTKFNIDSEDFDYAKLTEETESMIEYLENAMEEVAKMKVECAIANIELASSIDSIDLESQISALDKSMQEFIKKKIRQSDMEMVDESKDHETGK